MNQLLVGFLLGVIVGLLAWRAGALNRSGATAAALSGGLIFGLGGLAWAALLLSFFTSSSLLSRAFARRKAELSEKFSKGSRRDWGQVFANGGLGAILAVAYSSLSGPDWLWVAFAGAMAAVTADTWATELGVLSRSAPRRITDWKRVERGTSGGVTLLGYLAVLAGALFIGSIAAVLSPDLPAQPLLLSVLLGGVAGSTLDSILGATVQAIYCCPACGKETERHPSHTCGTPTIHVRGWPWLDNDLVNFACSVAGAVVALAVWVVFN